MKRISVAIAAVSCVLVLALAGCSGGSGGSGESSNTVDADSLKGVWVLDTSTPVGFYVAVNLDDEDFAEMVVSDSYLSGTWKVEGSEAKLLIDDQEAANMYVSDGKLVIGKDDGSKLVFTKSEDEELAGENAIEIDGSDLEGLTEEELAALDLEDETPDDVNIADMTPISVADDKYCTIEATGKGAYDDGDPAIRFSFTNKSDKALFIYANEDDFEVDGKKIDSGMGDVAEPGETVDVYTYFDHEELGGGVEKLKNVKATIRIGDEESDEDLATYTFTMD